MTSQRVHFIMFSIQATQLYVKRSWHCRLTQLFFLWHGIPSYSASRSGWGGRQWQTSTDEGPACFFSLPQLPGTRFLVWTFPAAADSPLNCIYKNYWLGRLVRQSAKVTVGTSLLKTITWFSPGVFWHQSGAVIKTVGIVPETPTYLSAQLNTSLFLLCLIFVKVSLVKCICVI